MEEKDVKQVLDDFENDDFVGAKEKLQDLVRTARDVRLKEKLGLEKDINPKQAPLQNPKQSPLQNPFKPKGPELQRRRT